MEDGEHLASNSEIGGELALPHTTATRRSSAPILGSQFPLGRWRRVEAWRELPRLCIYLPSLASSPSAVGQSTPSPAKGPQGRDCRGQLDSRQDFMKLTPSFPVCTMYAATSATTAPAYEAPIGVDVLGRGAGFAGDLLAHEMSDEPMLWPSTSVAGLSGLAYLLVQCVRSTTLYHNSVLYYVLYSESRTRALKYWHSQ